MVCKCSLAGGLRKKSHLFNAKKRKFYAFGSFDGGDWCSYYVQMCEESAKIKRGSARRWTTQIAPGFLRKKNTLHRLSDESVERVVSASPRRDGRMDVLGGKQKEPCRSSHRLILLGAVVSVVYMCLCRVIKGPLRTGTQASSP